jgi:hypothetical protein
MKYLIIGILAIYAVGAGAQTERSKQRKKTNREKADSWKDTLTNPHNLSDTAGLKSTDWDLKHTRKWMDSTNKFDTSKR